MGSMSGYYKTDFKDVMGKLTEINNAFGTYIQYVKDHPDQLTKSQKGQITDLEPSRKLAKNDERFYLRSIK